MPARDSPLVRRLALLLMKLNHGERLSPAALAPELDVSAGTLRRDLGRRLSFLPLEREGGAWRLDAAFAGRLGTRDVEHLAALAAVRGLLPADVPRELFEARVQRAFLAGSAAAQRERPALARPLEDAIVAHRRIGFELRKDEGLQAYADIEPYRLLRHKGAWYLAARDHGQFKTFSLARMQGLRVSAQGFSPDPGTERVLADDEVLWQARERVVLRISAEAAPHFRRRKLIASQKIEQVLEDGSLVVSVQAAHASQVLPIVRYWMPHLRILSPQAWQVELEDGLSRYLGAAARDEAGGSEGAGERETGREVEG
ncbi:helix-turn-helix transcriptional regulator [Azohydromonas caseinilytica]|uniref:WYL domain-containing protein n=1 Tax=Azohydromonas caseinilytica TaxID=2728836 RepID=A0A848FFH4_9BURK|nr:WYL domain-containing protein [Azohydromonas caseinilytica]NML16900.1 WYL domain-containing protein [Azohydromonas caseinilytica]